MSKYNADSIVQRKGAEKYRHSVARFLGSDNADGIVNMFYEILDNSIDETLRYSKEIKAKGPLPIMVKIDKDNIVTISDFGGGIPCEYSEKLGTLAIYPICEDDSAGAKSSGTQGYDSGMTAGVHGAGLAVSIANTEFAELIINSKSAKGQYRLRYEHGIRMGELERIGDLKRKEGNFLELVGVSESENPEAYIQGGTTIRFKYDKLVFKESRNWMTVDEIFPYKMMYDRLASTLIGTDGDFFIMFDHYSADPVMITNKSKTPEDVLGNNDLVELNFSKLNSIQDFKARLFLGYNKNSYDSKYLMFTNRLKIEESDTKKKIIDEIMLTVNNYRKRAGVDNPILMNEKLDSQFKNNFQFLLVLDLKDARYSGQTKQKLVSTDFHADFESQLRMALTDSEDFRVKIVVPVLKDLEDRALDRQRREKEEQKRKEKEEKAKLSKVSEEKLNELRKDKTKQILNKSESRITIKDSPLDIDKSTLVYVEGKSAGSVLNNIHNESRIPVAIAIAEGKMTNVSDYTDKDPIDDLTRDNIIYCLEQGYKDIAIFTDADSDGMHIKILHLMQIYKFAKRYLEHGDVYLIPAPYSKVYVYEPMILQLYGQLNVYEVGYTYTYSAKEHQSLISAGCREDKKYTGLANSDLAPSALVREREHWIKLNKITETDLKQLMTVLSSAYKAKRSLYVSDSFTERQFMMTYNINVKDEIKIKPDERLDLLNEDKIETEVDFNNYEAFLSEEPSKKLKNYIKDYV